MKVFAKNYYCQAQAIYMHNHHYHPQASSLKYRGGADQPGVWLTLQIKFNVPEQAAGATEGRICELEDGIIVELEDGIIVEKVLKMSSDIGVKCDADIVD